MKKLYTILGLAFLAGSVNAQIYFGKDFEDNDVTTGGCTNQVVVGSNDWYASSFNGNYFAKVSNGGTNDAEVWYITPGLDLTSATSPIFSFASASSSHTGPDIEVYTSIDYDGTSDPTAQGNWTQLSPALSTSAGNYDWVNSGEIAVPATSTTTYFAFKYTGTTTSGKVWEVDSVFVAEAGTAFGLTVIPPPASYVSVYDIQNATENSSYDGQTVETSGIVTYVRGDNRFYIQNGNGAFSGIYVYDANQTVSVGDSVSFTAIVDEYQPTGAIESLTELKNVSDLTVHKQNQFFLSTPITTGDIDLEEYESVLVKLCGVCVDEEGTYQDWTFNDGTGLGMVDNYLSGFHPSGTNIVAPVTGNSFQVTGIAEFSFDEYKVLPLDGTSVVQTSQCVASIDENKVNYVVYPNPAEDVINIEIDGIHTLSITDISGKVISTQVLNGYTSISTDELNAGIYLINVEGNISKVIVK